MIAIARAHTAWWGLALVPALAASACGHNRGGASPAGENREQQTPEWLGRVVQPLPAAETLPFRACSTDEDCVITTNGCCDCANGGEDIAVNAARLVAFRARLDCANKHGHCTEQGAMVPCGSGSARCLEARCEYIPPAPAKR